MSRFSRSNDFYGSVNFNFNFTLRRNVEDCKFH